MATPASTDERPREAISLGVFAYPNKAQQPDGDGVVRFLIELRCEKLRPQLSAWPSGWTTRLPGLLPTLLKVALQASFQDRLFWPPLTAARTRANEPPKRTRSTLSSRGVEPKRQGKAVDGPQLAALPLALIAEGPRNSTGGPTNPSRWRTGRRHRIGGRGPLTEVSLGLR